MRPLRILESESGEIHIKAKPTTKSSANTLLPDGNSAWKSSKQLSTSDSEGFYSNSETPEESHTSINTAQRRILKGNTPKKQKRN